MPKSQQSGQPARARDWYQPEYADRARDLALLGKTNAEIAAHFSVTERTVDRWIAGKPKFKEAIVSGREAADGRIARSLYERGVGYSHEAVKIFMPQGAKQPVYAPYTEHYPPDTTAAAQWLHNRQPKLWRNKQEVEHSGSLSLEHWVGQALASPAALPDGTDGGEKPG